MSRRGGGRRCGRGRMSRRMGGRWCVSRRMGGRGCMSWRMGGRGCMSRRMGGRGCVSRRRWRRWWRRRRRWWWWWWWWWRRRRRRWRWRRRWWIPTTELAVRHADGHRQWVYHHMVGPTRVHIHANPSAPRGYSVIRHTIGHAFRRLLRIECNGDQFVGKKSIRVIIVGIEYDNTAMNFPGASRRRCW